MCRDVYDGGGYAKSSPQPPSDRKQNAKILLELIKKQLNISDDDMNSVSIVKAKIRESNIDKILDK